MFRRSAAVVALVLAATFYVVASAANRSDSAGQGPGARTR